MGDWKVGFKAFLSAFFLLLAIKRFKNLAIFNDSYYISKEYANSNIYI